MDHLPRTLAENVLAHLLAEDDFAGEVYSGRVASDCMHVAEATGKDPHGLVETVYDRARSIGGRIVNVFPHASDEELEEIAVSQLAKEVKSLLPGETEALPLPEPQVFSNEYGELFLN